MADVTLKAFRLLVGGHVGPDYAADPAPIDPNVPGSVVRYPSAMFKARGATPAGEPVADVVYSPTDLSKKHNHPNSTKFQALGDAPAEVVRKFKDSATSGRLFHNQGGPSQRMGLFSIHRPVSATGGRAVRADQSLTEDRQAAETEKANHGDPRDVSEDADDGLEEYTVDELKKLAAKEKVDLPSGARKDEIIESIRSARSA